MSHLKTFKNIKEARLLTLDFGEINQEIQGVEIRRLITYLKISEASKAGLYIQIIKSRRKSR